MVIKGERVYMSPAVDSGPDERALIETLYAT